MVRPLQKLDSYQGVFSIAGGGEGMIKKINKRKHKALEEQYEHYVCEFCMEIGAKEAISKLLKDCNHKGDYYYISINDYYKWKKRCENND